MVVRPAIEQWSRGELEEKYHWIRAENEQLQQKYNEVTRKVIQLNTRFRRSIIDRKSEKSRTIDESAVDDLRKENQLLNIKLKTLKHQLLTYTHPSSRLQTVSALTGRSTVRMVAAVAPRGPSVRTVQSDNVAAEQRNNSSRRINENAVAEKASIIKLNRLLREKNAQNEELHAEIELLRQRVSVANTELETKASQLQSMQERIEELSSEWDRNNQNDGIQSVTTVLNEELRDLKNENGILKEANERLIKHSLEREIDGGASEAVELQKELVAMEERWKAAVQKTKELEKRLEKERRNHSETVKQSVQNSVSSGKIRQTDDEGISDEKRRKRRKHYNEKDSILPRLYRDVASLIESHNTQNEEDDLLDITPQQNAARWQRLYTELYEEMEKVRNMLLVQHSVGQKQLQEISLLEADSDRLRRDFGKKLKELADIINDKEKKISLLEEKIRAIAYGKQKMIIGESGSIVETETVEENPSLSEIVLTITRVTLSPSYLQQYGGTFFLSLEFFDFELQTTPVLQASSAEKPVLVQYTVSYNVVVSRLFAHYLRENGIGIEVYRPKNNSYELMGAAAFDLSTLFTQHGALKKEGSLKIRSPSTGDNIMLMEFEIAVSNELTESLRAYKKQERALLHVAVKDEELEVESSNIVELKVEISRAIGIDKLCGESSETSFVYEFGFFSPFYGQPVARKEGTSLYNHHKTWPLTLSSTTEQLLGTTDMTIYIVDNGDVLGVASFPLNKLLKEPKIRGTFDITTSSGEPSGAKLEASVSWSGANPFLKKEVEERTRANIEFPTKAQELHGGPPERQLYLTDNPPPPIPVYVNPNNVLNSRSRLRSSTSSTSSSSSSSTSTSSSKSKREGDEFKLEDRSRMTEDDKRFLEAQLPPDMPALARSASGSSRSSSQNTIVYDRSPPKSERTQEDTFDPDFDMAPLKPSFLRRTSKSSDRFEIQEETGSDKVSEASPEVSVRSHEDITKHEETNSDRSPESPQKEESDEAESTKSEQNIEAAEQEQRKEEIRHLLGDLPPIAAPRRSMKQMDEEQDRSTRLHFTEPLHRSIPPSDTSDSSTPRKEPLELKEASGRSSLKETTFEEEAEAEGELEDCWVRIEVDSLYVSEESSLLSPELNSTNIYIDWSFLDFSAEECRVPNSKPLPRASGVPVKFAFAKEYVINERRLRLLDQWVRLGNRLEFNLNTDQGADSEELAVASVDLSAIQRDNTPTLSLYDVNGDHVGDLDIAISYSNNLNDQFNELGQAQF